MKLKKCLKEMKKMWEEIYEDDLTSKPDNPFVHGCPCCQYVVEKVHGKGITDDGDRKIIMLDDVNKIHSDGAVRTNCVDLCPLRTLWPNGCIQDDLGYPAEYERWSDEDCECDQNEAAGAIYNESVKLLADLKNKKKGE